MANVNPQPGPQPGPQLGPQPDFARLAQGLQQATTELGNFANLPAFAQGNALIQQMQQMQKQIQQVQQQMQQQLQQTSTAIRGDIQALRNDISTNNQAT
jgi:hypothetical protein